MKNIRAPKFFEGLYRDMRDRRLLLPALGLIVALLAVPVLLKSQASTPPPPPSTATADGGAPTAAEPAVVTEQLGITNYRKRLEELNSKNPFHQQYTGVPAGAKLHSTLPSSGTSASTPTGSTSTSTSTGSSTLGLPPATGGTSSTTSSPPISSAPSPSPSPPATVQVPRPTFHLYTYRASVKVGQPNKLADRAEVKRLALLPSKKKPIATFLGVSEDAKEAIFLISTDVDSVTGDGRCLPQRSACQYVVLKPGDKVSFHYLPDGNRYNLILADIHAVEIAHKPPKKVSGKAQTQGKLPKLGPG